MAHSATMCAARKQIGHLLRAFRPVAKHQAFHSAKTKEPTFNRANLTRGSAAEALVKLSGLAEPLSGQRAST
eukprot:4243894-Karenia_brevis.AAC.1